MVGLQLAEGDEREVWENQKSLSPSQWRQEFNQVYLGQDQKSIVHQAQAPKKKIGAAPV